MLGEFRAWIVVVAAWLATALDASAVPIVLREFGGLLVQPVSLLDATAPVETPHADLDPALAHFKNGDYDSAIATLTNLRAHFPHAPPPALVLARMFLIYGHPDEAAQWLDRASMEEPDYAGTHVTRGALALLNSRFDEAARHYQRALTLADLEINRPFAAQLATRARTGLAAIAAHRNDWAAARNHIVEALRAAPADASLHQLLGQALFHLGDPDAAFAAFARAVRLDPHLEPPAISLGWLYADRGDFTQAQLWLTRATRESLDTPGAHAAAAQLGRRLNRAPQPHAPP